MPSAPVRGHPIASSPELGIKVGIASNRLKFDARQSAPCLQLPFKSEILSSVGGRRPDYSTIRHMQVDLSAPIDRNALKGGHEREPVGGATSSSACGKATMGVTGEQDGPQLIAPGEVRYIKLGNGGRWAADAIEHGYVAFGYHSIPHSVCVAGVRDEIRRLLDHRGSEGAKTAGVNEVTTFYEMGVRLPMGHIRGRSFMVDFRRHRGHLAWRRGRRWPVAHQVFDRRMVQHRSSRPAAEGERLELEAHEDGQLPIDNLYGRGAALPAAADQRGAGASCGAGARGQVRDDRGRR